MWRADQENLAITKLDFSWLWERVKCFLNGNYGGLKVNIFLKK